MSMIRDFEQIIWNFLLFNIEMTQNQRFFRENSKSYSQCDKKRDKIGRILGLRDKTRNGGTKRETMGQNEKKVNSKAGFAS